MRTQPSSIHTRERIFYTGIATLFAILTFAGFSRSYYLKPLFGTPSLSILTHAHGALFSLWVLLFLIQAVLVAAHRTDLHRRLGMVGAALALTLLALGGAMTFVSVKTGYATRRANMDTLFVNALMDLILFALLFGAGMYFRNNKEIHKRLMTLSMVAVVLPAFARLPSAMSYIGLLIIGFSIVGIVYDAIFLKRVHPANIVGGALIILTTPLRFKIAAMPAWHNFVSSLVQ
jgi:hypothetical protein